VGDASLKEVSNIRARRTRAQYHVAASATDINVNIGLFETMKAMRDVEKEDMEMFGIL
jgi:predicted peroxiredoxin